MEPLRQLSRRYCQELADSRTLSENSHKAYEGDVGQLVEYAITQRVEQAGDRVVITAGGVIHDMFVNGTLEGGVNDVGEAGAQVSVAARFKDGRHNLYPGNKRVVAVTQPPSPAQPEGAISGHPVPLR